MSTDPAEDDADVMQQDDAYDESHMDEEVNYDEGEPEADDDGDAYESDSEVDELVDEIDESDKPPETNRRARRAPLRVKLMRRNTSSNSSPRRTSIRTSQRSTRSRASRNDSYIDESEDDELMDAVDEEEPEDDEDDGNSETTSDMPMTARQIARANRARGITTEELEELPMEESSRKKKLSETELQLRRSETARRRRNQSEKKLEDDKIETINRLLKKQAGKARGKDKMDGDPPEEGTKKPRDIPANHPQPFFRYINRADKSVLAVPLGEPYSDDNKAEGLYDYTLRTAFQMSREAWAHS